jgi:hypothetical protein
LSVEEYRSVNRIGDMYNLLNRVEEKNNEPLHTVVPRVLKGYWRRKPEENIEMKSQ